MEACKRCMDRMMDVCAEQRHLAVLLDCRRMKGQLSIMDRFHIMEYGQITRGAISRLALVNLAQNILPDNFAENVAVNRGVGLKVFTDIDKAVQWLKS